MKIGRKFVSAHNDGVGLGLSKAFILNLISFVNIKL